MFSSHSLISDLPKNIEPIFVLSLERSGSTLLRNILDAHPAIFAPAQLNIGKLCRWTYWASYYSISQSRKDLQEADRQAVAIERVRRYVSELMDDLTGETSKAIWCDKSTMNIFELDILKSVYPNARFICLYRNCYDYIHSYISISKFGFMEEVAPYITRNPLNFVSALADCWVDRTTQIMNFELGNTVGCHRVTYESLVSDVSGTLREMFNFLQLKWEDKYLGRVFDNKSKGPVEGDMKFQFSSKISTESVGKGVEIPLTYLDQGELARIDALLDDLGYPLAKRNSQAKISIKGVPDNRNKVTDNDNSMYEIIHRHLPGIIKERMEKFRSLNCLCTLRVSGKSGGVWTIDLTKPGGEIREENLATSCAIELSSTVLRSILSKELGAVEAFEKGLVGASGDIRMAINVGRMLFG